MRVSLSDKNLSLIIALFLDQISYLNPFRQLRERQKTFLSLLGLDYLQLKIIHNMAHSGVAYSAPLQYNGILFSHKNEGDLAICNNMDGP